MQNITHWSGSSKGGILWARLKAPYRGQGHPQVSQDHLPG